MAKTFIFSAYLKVNTLCIISISSMRALTLYSTSVDEDIRTLLEVHKISFRSLSNKKKVRHRYGRGNSSYFSSVFSYSKQGTLVLYDYAATPTNTYVQSWPLWILKDKKNRHRSLVLALLCERNIGKKIHIASEPQRRRESNEGHRAMSTSEGNLFTKIPCNVINQ